MLYLLFQLGGEEYVLDASRVLEVLPLVEVRAIPQSPVGVAGVFNYRGLPVPLIDLSELTLGKSARLWLSTRIILVRDGLTENLLGLIMEQATETIRYEPEDFVASPVEVAAAPYLEAITANGNRLIQRVDLDNLLSSSLRNLLFGHSEVVTHVANRY